MKRMSPEVAKQALGIQANNKLSPCPDMPNCVCSQHAGDQAHYRAAFTLKGPSEAAQARMKAIVLGLARTKLADEKPGYLRFEFTSALLGFVDDVEMVFSPQDEKIHFRSASRLGYSDLGANGRRIEHLRRLWESQ